MRVVVLSLTRDRLAYTRTCFRALEARAGCRYTHYVFDQGSTDGTAEWLKQWKHRGDRRNITYSGENIGISRALNRLLEETKLHHPYDVIVKVDNDCEPLTQNILRDCAEFVIAHPDWLISPRIEGLMGPPGTIEELDFPEGKVLRKGQIGGIFLAAHASVYETFRYDESNPVWGMDDVQISNGRNVGYLDHHVANHYLTTVGQHADMPWYWDRKKAEGLPL